MTAQDSLAILLSGYWEATNCPAPRFYSVLHLGGSQQQGNEEQGNSAGRKLRSADVTFPRKQPVLVSPIIIHHFVYKWEIAFSCSASSERLKLIWNNPPAKVPVKAPDTPRCHTLWLLVLPHYWYTNQSWLRWEARVPGRKCFQQRRCPFLRTGPT